MTMTAGNIAWHLTDMAQRQPDVDAILANLQRDSTGALRCSRITFQQLDAKSDAIGQGLRKSGVVAGSRVALCLRPGIDFFAVTFALFKIGAIPVLIDPGIGLRNFGRCLAQSEPAVFIGIPLVHLLRRSLGWAKATSRLHITNGWFGGTSLATIEQMGQGSFMPTSDVVTIAPTDAAAILFTSGSTGPAKGVVYTHANFAAQVESLRDTYGIRPGEIDLATFPLFGLFGPALGMTTVIPTMDFTRPGFVDPRNIIEPIQQFHITNMFGSPALIDRVGRYGAANGVSLPTLKRVISAGAPVPAAVLGRFSKLLSTDAQIFTPYGATESLPVSSIGSREILAETAKLTDRGKGVCVGLPIAGTKVRVIRITDSPIAEWTDELELPAFQIGEIVVQGPVVTREYFHRPAATKGAKISDPASGNFYHRMGDVGYFDEVGRLWFCGRKSQRVNTAIGDLFSTPVEGVFNTHPLVARSALVGIRGDRGQQPVMCIERTAAGRRLRQQRLREELLVLARNHEHTRMIHHVLFHPRFPVDIRHNAKINREKLAAWAQRKLK